MNVQQLSEFRNIVALVDQIISSTISFSSLRVVRGSGPLLGAALSRQRRRSCAWASRCELCVDKSRRRQPQGLEGISCTDAVCASLCAGTVPLSCRSAPAEVSWPHPPKLNMHPICIECICSMPGGSCASRRRCPLLHCVRFRGYIECIQGNQPVCVRSECVQRQGPGS